MRWRDPYWMPVNAIQLAIWQLKYPRVVCGAEMRNGVLGIRIEPSQVQR